MAFVSPSCQNLNYMKKTPHNYPLTLSDRLHNFFHSPLAGGVILILCTIVAITLANIPYTAHWYHDLWMTPFTIGFAGFNLTEPIELWINDCIMAVFFFVVGLEIKRELVAGQLSSLKQASLPLAAAIGGMVIPALIFTVFNKGTISESGWGIPMATDIAFALGVLSIMSKKVPLSLKIFLTALAIVDDLGAILVIAIFYSSKLDWMMLGAAALVFSLLMAFNRAHILKMRYYVIPSITLWILFLNSGVHATIAGVLIALTIPTVPRFSKEGFMRKSQQIIEDFKNADLPGVEVLANHEQHKAMERMSILAKKTIPPSLKFEHALHPVVTFFIMPIFALANAGVVVSADHLGALVDTQGLGITLGLVLGKPIGIMVFSWFAVKIGWAMMPTGANWMKLLAVACLGGIGFTMSIFIDNLAFSDPSLVAYGKMSILVASVVAAVLGCILLSKTKDLDIKDQW